MELSIGAQPQGCPGPRALACWPLLERGRSWSRRMLCEMRARVRRLARHLGRAWLATTAVAYHRGVLGSGLNLQPRRGASLSWMPQPWRPFPRRRISKSITVTKSPPCCQKGFSCHIERLTMLSSLGHTMHCFDEKSDTTRTSFMMRCCQR